MKKAIFPIVIATLTGCTLPTQLPTMQPVQSIAQLHDTVVMQCRVIGPALDNMNAMSSQLTPQAADFLSKATQYVDPVCGVLQKNPTASITVQQVQDMIDNGVPELLKVVSNSTLPDKDKTAADIAIVAAETAISFALENVSTSTAVPAAPASSVQ